VAVTFAADFPVSWDAAHLLFCVLLTWMTFVLWPEGGLQLPALMQLAVQW
jgi:hypothetical protein